MDEADLYDKVRELDTNLERFFRGAKASFQLKQFGLTGTELFVLRYLSRETEVKSSDIARTAGLSPGAITQVCDELVRMGLIERVRSRSDRRVVNVALTAKGEEKVQEMMHNRVKHLSYLFQRLGESDTNKLIELLGRMAGIMEEDMAQERGESK